MVVTSVFGVQAKKAPRRPAAADNAAMEATLPAVEADKKGNSSGAESATERSGGSGRGRSRGGGSHGANGGNVADAGAASGGTSGAGAGNEPNETKAGTAGTETGGTAAKSRSSSGNGLGSPDETKNGAAENDAAAKPGASSPDETKNGAGAKQGTPAWAMGLPGGTKPAAPNEPLPDPRAGKEPPAARQPSCTDEYESCMDRVCKNEHAARYECDSSLDAIEADPVDGSVSFGSRKIDGNDVRFGNDMYAYAKGSCIAKLKSCKLEERNSVEVAYKTKISRDMLTKGYFDAMSYNGEEAAAGALDAYAQCMGQFCGPGFSDCLSVAAVERRAPKCDPILKAIGRPMAVKKAFFTKLEQINVEICKSSTGYVDFDTKKCKVKVVFGKPTAKFEEGMPVLTGKMEKYITEQTFNVGEIVECTQSYFATFYEDKPDFWHGVTQAAKGVVKTIHGAGVIVLSVIPFTAPIGQALGGIGGGVSHMLTGTADMVEGGVRMMQGQEKGACFINGELVAALYEIFKINFRTYGAEDEKKAPEEEAE